MASEIRSIRSSTPRIAVLVVSSSPDDHRALRAIFSHSNWLVRSASSVQEALSWLQNSAVSVVVCEPELPDGKWFSLLRATENQPCPPRYVVATRLADDRLWAEVLNLGGYDVLAKPFDSREVFFSVRMAWESWHRQWGRVSDINVPPASPAVRSNQSPAA